MIKHIIRYWGIDCMKFVAKTLFGLEQVLAEELAKLGAKEISQANRAVLFEGDIRLLYWVNYMSRTALSVLMPVKEFRIKSADDLYRKSIQIEWDSYMDVENTFSVTPVVQSQIFNHTGYAGLRLKDAMADYFRKVRGRRPSVDAANPDILINLHISNDTVTVSLDSSLIPLFKRGYRLEQATAPLNEILAAGMLLISGWDGSKDLIDPMCGSGTIPIEAGLIACNVPAGKFRKSFGFQKWKGYDEETFRMIIDEGEAGIRKSPVKISGYDISDIAVNQAVKNVESAGLSDSIYLARSDFETLKLDESEGVIFINPPYGERLLPEETESLYSMIGTTLKHNFNGYTAWIISSNKESLKHIGLKTKEKHILFNGALECSFNKYELYRGSRKIRLV
jgi:putative N6-adenine-specific DNA methylase